jgi:hypothetical protein
VAFGIQTKRVTAVNISPETATHTLDPQALFWTHTAGRLTSQGIRTRGVGGFLATEPPLERLFRLLATTSFVTIADKEESDCSYSKEQHDDDASNCALGKQLV